MDVDTDNHSKERIPLSGVDTHTVQVVIIEYPVIHPLAGGTVIINFFIFFRSPWNRGIEPDIPVRFCVDTAAIG